MHARTHTRTHTHAHTHTHHTHMRAHTYTHTCTHHTHTHMHHTHTHTTHIPHTHAHTHTHTHHTHTHTLQIHALLVMDWYHTHTKTHKIKLLKQSLFIIGFSEQMPPGRKILQCRAETWWWTRETLYSKTAALCATLTVLLPGREGSNNRWILRSAVCLQPWLYRYLGEKAATTGEYYLYLCNMIVVQCFLQSGLYHYLGEKAETPGKYYLYLCKKSVVLFACNPDCTVTWERRQQQQVNIA